MIGLKIVEICVNNMLLEYRVHLENLNLGMFNQLMEVARRTSLSVKYPAIKKPKKKTSYVMYIEKRDALYNSSKGKPYGK